MRLVLVSEIAVQEDIEEVVIKESRRVEDVSTFIIGGNLNV